MAYESGPFLGNCSNRTWDLTTISKFIKQEMKFF
jgi:hypothetical protein